MEHIRVNCEIDIENFVCPLSNEIFLDPVMADDGHLYERQMISTWLSNNDISPITRKEMSDTLRDCYVIKNLITHILLKNPQLKDSQYKIDNTFRSNIPIIENYLANNRFDKLLDYIEYDMQYLFEHRMLINILEHGNDKISKHIFNGCTNINFSDGNGNSVVIDICEYGSDELIRHVIGNGVNLNWKDRAGWSILHYLCLRGLTESIRYVLDKGVSLEEENIHGWRPIHAACYYCNEDTIKLLISKNVNLRTKIKRFNDENKAMSCVDLIKLNKNLTRKSKDDITNLIYRLTKSRTAHKRNDIKKPNSIHHKNKAVKILN